MEIKTFKKKLKINTNYIDNKTFYNLLVSYKKKKNTEIYEKIGKCFLMIAENILNSPNFINYTDDRKSEMISDATFLMVTYLSNFELDKTNPFAYFSQIAINAFKQNINKNNKRAQMFIPLDSLQNLSRENMNDLLLD